MTHATLYTLANSLGILAMLTVVGYHIVAVNARHIAKNGEGKEELCTSFPAIFHYVVLDCVLVAYAQLY
ncbi:hypothetical protein DFH05DRAFT_963307 [Lentinula detonsa]|uniref:Uncharacterized protein n=1 Tax=Lentinula detonsa TaxID=2804962 RepID=A0A9W8TZP8_9AGAR|nr:hypothetical protein DFH05DRAFT_963307 [Lentinula detonsa]KAJ3980254.1 hypothetical protein F5890DRAFT_748947 [Lentinula detonsa]